MIREGTDLNETGPERFHSREEILSLIRNRCENPVMVRELRDENENIYLLEAKGPEKNGEFTMHVYQRKGNFPNKIESGATTLREDYFRDNEFYYSVTISDYDPRADAWIEQKAV